MKHIIESTLCILTFIGVNRNSDKGTNIGIVLAIVGYSNDLINIVFTSGITSLVLCSGRSNEGHKGLILFKRFSITVLLVLHDLYISNCKYIFCLIGIGKISKRCAGDCHNCDNCNKANRQNLLFHRSNILSIIL